jgi:folate-dependent phosphoribosylglycinamide formyltransferase PurN
MRILALVSNDVTYQPLVYEPLVESKNSDFVGIVLVPFSTKQKSGLRLLQFMYNLYGIKGFVYKTFQVLSYRLFDFIGRFIRLKRCYSIKSIAKKYRIPLFTTEKINSKACLEWIADLKPDIILSSQGHYIGKKLLSIPKIGIINKHAGMLPKYRGLYPVFWAMLNGEEQIGITIHFMNAKLDDGDIIVQETIPIQEKDTFESMYRKVIRKTPDLFIKAIDMLEENDKMKLMPNDESLATYFSFPGKQDIKKFESVGKRII